MSEQLSLLDSLSQTVPQADSAHFVVRESKRARRLFLHVVPPLSVELVVPKGTRVRTVEAFLNANRKWIERANAEIDRTYNGERSLMPQAIRIPTRSQQLGVCYRHKPEAHRHYKNSGDLLYVNCRQANMADSAKILQKWLISEARRTLAPWLYREAEKVGDVPKRVQVRLQRTRWGSCSGTGTISLNASLLLLDPALVRYVMIHELCHMRHMNHSAVYWRHVARFEPSYRDLDRQLGKSWADMPYWALAK